MNYLSPDLKLSEMESVLAIERNIVPEPDAIRERVVGRARASLMRNVSPLSAPLRDTRRVRIGIAAAGAVVLSAMCAAAFFAGYRVKSRNGDAVPNAPTVPPSIIIQQLPAPSVVVALIPIAPAASQPDTIKDTLRLGRATSSGTVKAAIDVERYTKELRVLQPARQAVAQQDFNSALSAIAEHQRQFPSGRLTEEREALRVKALLGLGRTAEAQRAGATFRSRFPRSALLGRIEEMLGKQK
jgi:hypothetical protein